jgi:HlyD family secretion protein
MKIKRFILSALISILFLFSSCGGRQKNGEKEIQARVPVTVENIHRADIADYLELNATTAFLVKSMIKSSTAGYVEEITVTLGDKVMKNQVLFKLRTKESTALQNDSLNPYSFSGLITLKANMDGVILSVDHPRGDYIQEGDQLATIAVPSSFVYILDVPYESVSYIKLSSSCEIFLPDGHALSGRIFSRLPSITPGSQTQRYIIHPVETQNMPENLIAKIRILKRVIPKAVLINKSCILADEVMQHFWVMKLMSDFVAVKIPVTTGQSSGNDIEITSPTFSTSDLFLASGNYGLGDTVKVIVTKKMISK